MPKPQSQKPKPLVLTGEPRRAAPPTARGVLGALASDHLEIELLFERLLVESQPTQRKALWVQCRQLLLAHEYAEVRAVCCAVVSDEPGCNLLRSHLDDALRNETLIYEVEGVQIGSDEWQSRLLTLKNAVANHLLEEEGEVFSALQAAVGPQRLGSMEYAFQVAKAEAIAGLARAVGSETSVNGVALHPLHRLCSPSQS